MLNGTPVPRRKLKDVPIPITQNSPCRIVPPAIAATVTSAGHSYCIYKAYMESLPGGPSYTTFDQLDTARPTISGRSGFLLAVSS